MSLQNIIDFFRDITFVQGFIASLLATIVVGIALFLWRRLRDWRKSFVGLNTEPGTNQSATNLFNENSELCPVTRQKLVKLCETLKQDKLTRWLWFNSRGVKITRFDGGTIDISGIPYGQSQAMVFWDFIVPFLQNAIVKTMDETLETCHVRGLRPEEPYIRETAMLLDGYLIDPIYRYMADIDWHIRGKGNPKSVGRRDVTDEITEMVKFLDKCKDEMIQGIRQGKDNQDQTKKSAKTEQEINATNDNLRNDKKSTVIWDVFVCHASEDKNGFVKPLADALKRIGLRVWYDEFSLKTGDSLRQAIEKGLSQSQYGIVIISPRFLKKDWPQKELDGLVAREVNGKKVILPIWHEIDANILLGYSPMLAGRKAISSTLPLNQIIKQLLDDMEVKPKRKVGIDTFHGDTWGGLTNLLGDNAFELVRINSKIDDESLRPINAMIIATRGMNSDKGFEESEIDAIQGFVANGGSILCVDLAWSWVYPKYGNKPLEQFPLNLLGKRIGFCITGKNINPPAHFSTEIMEGVKTVKREKWDSSEIEFYGQNAQGFIMDDKDRIIAGMMPVGEGLVAVVGHRGLLIENPEIMLRILAYFAREKQWTACG